MKIFYPFLVYNKKLALMSMPDNQFIVVFYIS